PLVGGGLSGSSPRVRGAPSWRSRKEKRSGIIPACAGSTRQRCPIGSPTADHPRVCGEHAKVRLVLATQQGSSPRVRGAPPMAGSPRRRRRIIPACAGSTRGWGCPFLGKRGSSPRVRGAHLMTRDYSSLHRKTDSLCVGVGPAASEAVGIL